MLKADDTSNYMRVRLAEKAVRQKYSDHAADFALYKRTKTYLQLQTRASKIKEAFAKDSAVFKGIILLF